MEGLTDFVSGIVTFTGVVLGVGFLLLVAWLIYRRRYRRIGPDEALVVYGRRARKDRDGFRIIVGGGTFVVPFTRRPSGSPCTRCSWTCS